MARKRRLALDKRMQKAFPDHTIALHAKGEKETMVIDGVEIDLAWIPHSKNVNDMGAYNTLVKDCKLSIERHLNSI